MHQTTHFFNLGYGWLCKHCSAEESERKYQDHHAHGERKPPTLVLAKWLDDEHGGLMCPRCGIEENVRKIL
jgi:hypothetical protein